MYVRTYLDRIMHPEQISKKARKNTFAVWPLCHACLAFGATEEFF